MTSEEKYIVFIDLDKTLLKINSGVVFIKEAYKNGQMSLSNLIHALYLAVVYKFNLRNTSEIISDMPKWMRNLSEEEVKKLGKYVFRKHLFGAIRPEIISEIKRHRENRAKIVILSASTKYVCEPIAKELNLDDIICSEMEIVNGLFTGQPSGKLCFDEEKLVRVRKYCDENGYSLESAYFYGDSYADYPVLNAVGNPVCVSPDKELLLTARNNSWIIYEWK